MENIMLDVWFLQFYNSKGKNYVYYNGIELVTTLTESQFRVKEQNTWSVHHGKHENCYLPPL
jgi:hypothetical protein